MALTTVAKADIIQKYQRAPQDTGSSEVQIALLSANIEVLTEHQKRSPKDVHSQRGLVRMVSRRRKLLDYLKRVNLACYTALIQDLGLRK